MQYNTSTQAHTSTTMWQCLELVALGSQETVDYFQSHNLFFLYYTNLIVSLSTQRLYVY